MAIAMTAPVTLTQYGAIGVITVDNPPVNEACRILEEGITYRPSDIDAMWLNGFGFPRYRGGLMYWADGIGVEEIHSRMRAWETTLGSRWRPARLLTELVDSGRSFADL